MLKALNLRKEYSNVLAVDDVSFEVGRGEILGLLGPNGAGKTTSIRIVLNILQPNGGTVMYDGRPFTEQVRNIVGYLPEERGLYKKSTLFSTILYFAEIRGMQTGLAKAETYKWLQRFNLLTYKERKVEELSKGNQQKVQFITAVIHDPVLVILDEPFSGLDPVNQVAFKEVFMELKQRGKAVIFSTHQMDTAEKLSDSLCLINKGRVVLSGTVRDVKRKYGRNAVHLEFSGDGTFLKSLASVRHAMLYENSAELDLNDGFTAQSLLAEVISRIEIRKFEIREPSLHSIFLQIVGGSAPANVPPEVEA
ncbi:MAG: ABC transporter ATP-binding protein [Bacteroidota bacterium]